MNKILLAEDQGIVITGIKSIIHSLFPEFELDVVKSMADLHKRLAVEKYELAIFGLQLEGGAVINHIISVIHSYNELRVLVYSANTAELALAPRLYRAGIRGFLTREADDAEIGFAIKTILSDRIYISAKIQKDMLQIGDIKEEHLFNTLSAGELKVLMLLLSGKGTAKIAAELELAAATVSNSKKNIFKKLKVDNILQVRELMNKKKNN